MRGKNKTKNYKDIKRERCPLSSFMLFYKVAFKTRSEAKLA